MNQPHQALSIYRFFKKKMIFLFYVLKLDHKRQLSSHLVHLERLPWDSRVTYEKSKPTVLSRCWSLLLVNDRLSAGWQSIWDLQWQSASTIRHINKEVTRGVVTSVGRLLLICDSIPLSPYITESRETISLCPFWIVSEPVSIIKWSF